MDTHQSTVQSTDRGSALRLPVPGYGPENLRLEASVPVWDPASWGHRILVTLREVTDSGHSTGRVLHSAWLPAGTDIRGATCAHGVVTIRYGAAPDVGKRVVMWDE